MGDARSDRVGERGHQELDRGARVESGGRGEIHAVGEERVQLVIHLAIGPLRIGLPAGDGLEPRGALERHRLGKAAVEDQGRLVNLQRDGDAILSDDEVLMMRTLADARGLTSSDLLRTLLRDAGLLPRRG